MTSEEKLELAKLLAEFFKDDPHKIALWLLSDNPNFGCAPCDLVAVGRGHKVLNFAREAICKTQTWSASDRQK